jgi:hypothetical protein
MEIEIVGACSTHVENGKNLQNCWKSCSEGLFQRPECRERSGSGDLSLLQNVQTRSGTLPASCIIGVGVSLPAGKEAGT